MLNDTDPAVERAWDDLWRRASPDERLARALGMTATVRNLSWQAISEALPGSSEARRRFKFTQITYGRDLALRVFGGEPAQ